MKNLLKKIYTVIPFKKELFSILKIIWKPSHRYYKHLHFKGVFNIDIDKSRSFKIKHYGFELENEIFWQGLTNGWEKESLKLWVKLCEKSDIILDIGANTGIYSLVAKAVNPASKVFAFEPVHRVFTKLVENITLNNFDTIPIEKAISNSNGTAVIYDLDSEHVYSVTVNKDLSVSDLKTIETKIETVTLNSFIKEYNLNKIDLIKIDVETHEPEVLEGFNEYISVYKPTILIEILNDEVGEKVNKLVTGLDYLFFNINEDDGIRQVEKITQSDFLNYLLCNEKTAKELGLIN